MSIESETFEFYSQETDSMCVKGFIDGRLQSVICDTKPSGYVRACDLVSRASDFENSERTDYKVKLNGKEYDVWKFFEKEPKFIGRKAKGLAELSVPTFETDVPYKRKIFVDNVFKISYKNRVAFLDFEMDDSLGFRDYGEMPFLASTIGINGALRTTHVSDFDTQKDFIQDIVNFLFQKRKTVFVGFNTQFDYKHLKGMCDKLGVINHLDYCYPYDMRERYKDNVKGLTTYSLEEVALYEKIGSKHREGRVIDMPKRELLEYNNNDVVLLMELEKKYGFVKTDIALQEYIGLPMSMSSAYLRGDTMVLRRLHELGYVAINAVEREENKYQGAFVKEPEVGYFENVINLDALSMYPTIIDVRNVDIEGFNGDVIPHLVKIFTAMKAEATKNKDPVARGVAKIMSNMLYGLFGFTTFRYYERVKAEFIASEGRDIVQKIADILGCMGIKSLYADTDSAFIKVDDVDSPYIEAVVRYVNSVIAPFEVKIDHKFKQIIFFRKDSGEPSKKRYVGLEDNGALLARGVEIRRGDWCPLAKRNLKESIMVAFKVAGAVGVGAAEKVIKYKLACIKKNLFYGLYDDELIIRKGLKDIKDYKVATPQVKAFEKGIKRGLYTGKEKEVSYYFDINGEVEPWIEGKKTIDYKAYYERQILPPINRLLISIREEKGRQMGFEEYL